jgi:hypothetical protein
LVASNADTDSIVT